MLGVTEFLFYLNLLGLYYRIICFRVNLGETESAIGHIVGGVEPNSMIEVKEDQDNDIHCKPTFKYLYLLMCSIFILLPPKRFVCFCLGTEHRTHFSEIFGLHDAWSCHHMAFGGGGWGEGQIPRSGACNNTQYPWIQLTVQQGSQERVSEGDRAAVFTRTYLEPNIMARQRIA